MRRKLGFERLEDRRVLNADFSANGVVDAPDLDKWRTYFGTVNIGTPATGDADDDEDVDGADFLAWQRTLGQFTGPPVAPRDVEARALGATSGEVTWQASVGATSYAVARRRPDTETAFTITAPNVTATSYVDSGLASDTLYEYVVIARRNPDSVPSQLAQFTTNQSNLTAYRPQGVKPFDDAPDAPFYDPFPRRPVLEQDEMSNTLGPGIRINYDDDNSNGIADAGDSGIEVYRENDLIEVRIDRLPGQGPMTLTVGGGLVLYYTHDKDGPVPMDPSGTETEPLSFFNDRATVWVEWANPAHGFATLSLNSLLNFHDSVRFHSFRSLIVAFGGFGQNPQDTDGDGFIGDQVEEDDIVNREGIFDLAQFFYNAGWDVVAFDEEAIDEISTFDPSLSLPYQEILTGLRDRFVEAHAVMGYSQGGGAAHDVTETLYFLEDIVTRAVVYLDAVQQDSFNPQTDWPEVTAFMLNIYSEVDEVFNLGGGDIDDDEPDLYGATLVEINTTVDTGWDHTLDHYNIDDNFAVQDQIWQRLHMWLVRR